MLRTLTQPLLEGEETCASPRSSLLLTSPPLTQSRCIGTSPLPEQIELHRDRMWRRDEELRIESAVDAERFIEKKPKPGSGLRFVRFSINTSHGEILCEPDSPQLVLAANSYSGEMNNRATVEPKSSSSRIAIMTR